MKSEKGLDPSALPSNRSRSGRRATVDATASQPAACNRQCHGCALRTGAAANEEPHNRLRGIFAALGGYPFACHDSLGWGGDDVGYPKGAVNALAILHSQRKIIAAGADPELIEKQVAEVRRNLRMCGGWRAAVARLKAAGWFAGSGVTSYRRYMAKRAAGDLEHLKIDSPDADGNEIRDIKATVEWFLNEAKDSRISINWLFASAPASNALRVDGLAGAAHPERQGPKDGVEASSSTGGGQNA